MSRRERHSRRSASRLITLALGAMLLAPAATAIADGWASGAPAPHTVPLERTLSGVWIIEATLNGRVRGRFLLDTGASYCGVTTETAARLRLSQVGESLSLQTAGGVVPMPVVRLASVQVGGRRARQVQAVILPENVGDLDGIIGMSFLNLFTYSIDPRRSVLRLQ